MGKGGGSAKMQVVDYRMSIHMGISAGPLDAITKIRIGEKVAWTGEQAGEGTIVINRPELFGGEQKEGGVSGIAYYLPGGASQTLPAGFAARLGLTPSTAPGYRNMSTIWFAGEVGSAGGNGFWAPDDLAYAGIVGGTVNRLVEQASRYGGFLWSKNSPFIRPTWITGRRAPKGLNPAISMIGPDANPAHIIYEVLTSTDFGLAAPSSTVDGAGTFAAVAQQLYDENFGLSLWWSRQGTVKAFIQEILDHIQAVLYIDPASGKWTIKLLRDDYVLDNVATFDMSNAKLLSFQRKAWGEIVNEIVVTWTNPETEKEETVTVQNLAAIEAQGDVSSDSRNYYAVRNRTLATDLAFRDLRQSSTPLAAVSLEVRRGAWDIPPGSVVRLNWPQHEIDGVVLRVMSVTRSSKRAFVRINLLEDIFSLTRPALPVSPGTDWEDPSIDPPELSVTKIFTLPYAMSARLGMAGVEDGFLFPEAIAGVLFHHESADVTGVDLYGEVTLPDGELRYERIGTRQLAGYSVLTTAFVAEASTVYADTPGVTTGRTPVEGGFALIGSGNDAATEIALVKANPGGGWILQRGAFDTVPREWPVGTQIWFMDSAESAADQSRVRGAGETARYKPLARSSRGTLDLSSVSPVSATVSDRPHRPARPANVQVNGQGFGAVDISAASTISVTWSRRNRLTEDAAPLAWTAGDVQFESGQVTAIRLLATNGSVIKTWQELPGTSFTFNKSELGGASGAYIEVLSTRDGLGSQQNWGAWLLDGLAEPASPPTLPDVDDAAPPNQDKVEAPTRRGENVCPDPFFQDVGFWNFAGSAWYSVSRAGSPLPAQMNAPKAAVISSQWYTGTVAQIVSSDLVVGLLAAGEDLWFSANAVNDSAGTVALRLIFVRSETNAQIGDTVELSWTAGQNGKKDVKVVQPAGADACYFQIVSSGGAAWSGNAGITNVRLIEFSAQGVGGTPAVDLLADVEESLTGARDLIAAFDADAATALEAKAAVLAAIAEPGSGAVDLAGLLAEEKARINTNTDQANVRTERLENPSGNLVFDPQFSLGPADWRQTPGVQPFTRETAQGRALFIRHEVSAASVAVRAIHTQRRRAIAGERIEVGVEADIANEAGSPVLELVSYDSGGSAISTQTLALSTGYVRSTGFFTLPANTAEIELAVRFTSTGAGVVEGFIRKPLWRRAEAGQVTPTDFASTRPEALGRLIEERIASAREVSRSIRLLLQNRELKALYENIVITQTDGGSALVTRIETLESSNATLSSSIDSLATTVATGNLGQARQIDQLRVSANSANAVPNSNLILGPVDWTGSPTPPRIALEDSKRALVWNGPAEAAGQVARWRLDTSFPVRGGQKLEASAALKCSGVASMAVRIVWFDADMVEGDTVEAASAGPASFARHGSLDITAPASARYAKFEITVTASGSGAGRALATEFILTAPLEGQTTLSAYTPQMNSARESMVIAARQASARQASFERHLVFQASGARAAISEEAQVRETEDGVLAEQITALDAAYKAADAALQTDVNTRATNVRVDTVEAGAASSLASTATAIRAEFAASDAALQTDINSRATVTQLNQAVSDAAGARATLGTAIRAEFAAADAGLQTDINTRATATALTQAVSDEASARATAVAALDAAYKAADAGLQTQVNAKAAITYVDTAISNEAGSRASAIAALDAAYKAADTTLQTDINTRATTTALNQAVADAAGARTTLFNQITANYEAADAGLQTQVNNRATVTQLNEAIATEAGARASADTTLQTNINGVSSTATSALSIANTANGKLTGRWGLVFDLDGRVTSAALFDDGTTRAFNLAVDVFTVEGVQPFSYNSQTGVLSAGSLEVDGAKIKNATIGTLQLETGAVVQTVGAEPNEQLSHVFTTSNPKRGNTAVFYRTRTLPNPVPGASVAILIDFLHRITLPAFDWAVMELYITVVDFTPTQQAGVEVYSSLWVQPGSSKNGQFPGALQNNSQQVTVPRFFMFEDNIPDPLPTGLTSRRYDIRVRVSSAWDDGSTLLQGYDTPTHPGHHAMIDTNILLLHFKR